MISSDSAHQKHCNMQSNVGALSRSTFWFELEGYYPIPRELLYSRVLRACGMCMWPRGGVGCYANPCVRDTNRCGGASVMVWGGISTRRRTERSWSMVISQPNATSTSPYAQSCSCSWTHTETSRHFSKTTLALIRLNSHKTSWGTKTPMWAHGQHVHRIFPPLNIFGMN